MLHDLKAHQAGSLQALYFRLADLLHFDVELIFCDTASLYFEIGEIDPGEDAANNDFISHYFLQT